MAQTWTADCFNTANYWDDDLQAMENNHLALQSSFSGAMAPTSPVQGQLWEDTGSGALKKYDGAAWMAVLQGDASFKIPVYRNGTCDGWTIDATVSDRVLAIKGGTGLYNANGGTNAGETWANLKAHTHDDGTYAAAAHNHQWYDDRGSTNHHRTWDENGSIRDLAHATQSARTIGCNTGHSGIDVDCHTNNETVAISGNRGPQSTSDPRPQAALCTLQYPDLT